MYVMTYLIFLHSELINPRPQSRQSRKGSAREDERRGKPKAAKPAPTSKRQSSKSGGKKS